ncbi:arylamine N-acetyltransferase family protein [Streptomyces griseofuscus]|uniref:arylamine N-acetyltransferase family protein n=1 Tax=Streptomyces griseofuscus TaxID=146922 RepID=UPI00371D9B16
MIHAGRRSRRPVSSWGAERLDLGAYLERVGMPHLAPIGGPVRSQPTLREVCELHRAHLAAIPFDNIDFVLDTPVSLEPEAIVEKLCRRRRGGCCHEHNLLFGLVLERLGLSVERLAARVLLGGLGPRPRTHMLLKTRIGDDEWLCDVGFGSDGYLDPLPAREGAETTQFGRGFRVVAHDRFQWSVDVRMSQGWTVMYQFTHESQQPMDFTVAHHFLSTHPGSMLRKAPLLQLLTVGTSLQLRGDLLKRVTPTERSVDRVTVDALPRVLGRFGITLTEPELAALTRTFPDRSPARAD